MPQLAIQSLICEEEEQTIMRTNVTDAARMVALFRLMSKKVGWWDFLIRYLGDHHCDIRREMEENLAKIL